MNAIHSSVSRSMTLNAEAVSRTKLLREWEELCAVSRPTNTPKPGNGQGHGDANSWIVELNNPNSRAQAMQNLCTHHRRTPDLGVLLWHSFGAVSSLVQEILNAYLKWDMRQSDATRILNALTLLESVAEHPRSRIQFVCSKLHEFIGPLARQGQVSGYKESFRQAALRVIHALLDQEQSDRAFIAEKEYGCIVMQLLVDDFLNHILFASAKHGQPQSQLLVVQILTKVTSHDDILTVFTGNNQSKKNLCHLLEHLHNVFQTRAAFVCPLLIMLYNRVQRTERSKPTPSQYRAPIGE